jgi:TPR repeat protein
MVAVQPNYGVNATVRPVTPLANAASVAPVRPARYASRQTAGANAMRLKAICAAVSFAGIFSGIRRARIEPCRLTVLAEQGSASAQYNLGMLYNNGIGTTADPNRAFELFQKAAAPGDPLASYKVGCYYAGQFPDVVAVDHEKALAAKLVAAKSGYLRAELDVANIYRARRDVDEVMKWETAAAEQGDEGALVGLYSIYRWGFGVPMNDAKALELLLIISRRLPEDRRSKAQVTIESLKKALDATSVAQAEKSAAAWAPKVSPLTIRANMGISEARQLVQP